MQHGTGREQAIDLLENVIAISTQREVISAVNEALSVLVTTEDLDQRGVYGPDYGDSRYIVPRVTKAERDEAVRVRASLEWEPNPNLPYGRPGYEREEELS